MIDAKNLIRRMSAMGYTYKRIATAAGLSALTISFLATGRTKKASPGTQEKLLKAYADLAEQAAQRAAAIEEADEKFRRLSGE